MLSRVGETVSMKTVENTQISPTPTFPTPQSGGAKAEMRHSNMLRKDLHGLVKFTTCKHHRELLVASETYLFLDNRPKFWTIRQIPQHPSSRQLIGASCFENISLDKIPRKQILTFLQVGNSSSKNELSKLKDVNMVILRDL